MTAASEQAIDLYLDLMKKCLTRYIFGETYGPLTARVTSLKYPVYRSLKAILGSQNLALMKRVKYDPALREEGLDWPASAETMIGLRRLDSLQTCLVDIIRDGIAGDVLEAGVWRGGATIFMRAVLKAYGENERTVWVADSFQGLPKPSVDRYPADRGDRHWTSSSNLAVPLDIVQSNFMRYGLLDEQVRFLVGWFKDTLPSAPIEHLALLRVDGDMYESTADVLYALYSKVTPGGYVVIDDYGAVPGCKQAVDDFRATFKLTEPLIQIDRTGVYWRHS